MVIIRRVYKKAEYRIYKNGRLSMGSFSESDMTEMAVKMKKKDTGAQIEIVRYEVIGKAIL